MGWLQLKRRQTATPTLHTSIPQKEPTNTHIENIHLDTTHPLHYPPQLPSIPDSQLPFISSTTITTTSRLWLVIDNIVYDCTDFVSEHPGGSTVINSFTGKDCSWQFWRFHTKKHMREFGRELRVGRTEGVKNPFKEPVRFVGLRKLGVGDEWD
jgi:cytochrome b involved in lipid metabolism